MLCCVVMLTRNEQYHHSCPHSQALRQTRRPIWVCDVWVVADDDNCVVVVVADHDGCVVVVADDDNLLLLLPTKIILLLLIPCTSYLTCFSEIQDFPYAKFQQGYYYHVTPVLRLCDLNITAMLK